MKPIEVSDEVVDVIELILRREGETVPDVIARLIGEEARRLYGGRCYGADDRRR